MKKVSQFWESRETHPKWPSKSPQNGNQQMALSRIISNIVTIIYQRLSSYSSQSPESKESHNQIHFHLLVEPVT